MAHLLPILLLAIPFARGFSFTVTSPPTQCSNLTLEWSGGTPPYEITIVSIAQQDVASPEGNMVDTNTSSTSWSQQLLFPEGANIAIVLSDATGFGTGGTSDILTVANGTSDSCLPTSLNSPSFIVGLQFDAFNQCAPALFYFVGNYKPPVVLSAIIPGGNSWVLPITDQQGNGTQDWVIDIPGGTEVEFIAGDSTGRVTGGNFPLFTVGASGNSSCLPETTSSSSNSSSTGAIVGGVIGGVVGLAAIILLSCFFLRRIRLVRRRRSLNEKAIGLRSYTFS